MSFPSKRHKPAPALTRVNASHTGTAINQLLANKTITPATYRELVLAMLLDDAKLHAEVPMLDVATFNAFNTSVSSAPVYVLTNPLTKTLYVRVCDLARPTCAKKHAGFVRTLKKSLPCAMYRHRGSTGQGTLCASMLPACEAVFDVYMRRYTPGNPKAEIEVTLASRLLRIYSAAVRVHRPAVVGGVDVWVDALAAATGLDLDEPDLVESAVV